MEKNVLQLLQAVLMNITEFKGDEREQTISTFKERLGINASLLQKVSLLIRKEGLILKGRSMNNKFKISQRQLRNILTGILGTVVICGRFKLSLVSAHLQGISHPSDRNSSWANQAMMVQSAWFASSTLVPFLEGALARGRNSFEVLSSTTACLKPQHLCAT